MKTLCSFCKHLDHDPTGEKDYCRKSYVKFDEFGPSTMGHNCIHHSGLTDLFEAKPDGSDKVRADRAEQQEAKLRIEIRELEESVSNLKNTIRILTETSNK